MSMKKSMKKCLALVLSLILAFSFCACSQQSASSAVPDQQSTSSKEVESTTPTTDKTALTWMSWGHARPQEIRQEALEAAFPELAEKYMIEPVIGGKDIGAVVEKMRLGLASNDNLPDIFQTSSMYFPEMAASGVLADVSYIYDKYEGELLDGMKDLCTYEGKQYAFPYCENTLVWIYRTDIFEDAGIDVSGIKTIDDFIAAGEKLREKYPDAYMHAGNVTDIATTFTWCAPGNDTKMIDENGNYIFKDDENAQALLTDLKKLYDSGLVYDVAAWTPDWEQGFANEKIVSYLTCNWFKDAAFLPTYAPETAGKWGVVTWPEIGGGKGGSENGGAMIMVLNDSPNKDAAIEVLESLCFTKEGNLAMYEASDNSLTPVMIEAYNDPSVAAGDSFFGDVFWKGELESMSLYKTMDFTPAAALESKILMPYIEKYLMGELSMEDALSQATSDMEIQIGNPLQMS